MGTKTKAGAPMGAGHLVPTLPPVTVGRLEEAATLIERLFDENVELFIREGQGFKAKHREGTSRPLHADEAAQIAAGLAEADRIKVAEEVQSSTLRAYDEPSRLEILMAAGMATAPAFMAAVRRVVALLELSADDFEAACVAGTLAETVDERATGLRKLEVGEARARAVAAMEHYATAAGFEPKKAWRLLTDSVQQALVQAVSHLDTGSQLSQLIASAPSTEASPRPTSSTDSPGSEPSS